jgi:hypothetical protein
LFRILEGKNRVKGAKTHRIDGFIAMKYRQKAAKQQAIL